MNKFFNWYKFAYDNYLSIGHEYNPENPSFLYIVTENGNIYTKKWDGHRDTIHDNIGMPHYNDRIAGGRFDPTTQEFSLVIFEKRFKNTTFTQMQIKEIVKNHFGQKAKMAYHEVDRWQ